MKQVKTGKQERVIEDYNQSIYDINAVIYKAKCAA